MLGVNFQKDRNIFYNQRRKTIFLKRFLIVFFLLMLAFTYVAYNFFFFAVHIQDKSMLPSLTSGSVAFFKPISVNERDKLQEIIPRGSIVAIKKPHIPEQSVFRKIFDVPVYLLTLGWVKLSHREVIVRRLLAYPGEKLEVRNKVIYLNDKLFLPEWIIKYQDVEIFPAKISSRDNLMKSYIDNNYVFVLNDNWDQGNDSRLFGEVKIEDIEGVFIYNYSSRELELE